ncbi:MAG: hypothetical protein NZM27_00325 [Acetobacteraceae bacterium]|nr:hypothetical protein [Acetobacteraceae bacterium]MDW8399785.1 hypothetical protein [Acetobacteraceae bacterium]
MPPALPLCCALLSSACAPAAAPEIRLLPLRLPGALLVCAAAPALPAAEWLTQGQAAELLLAYDAAHADCAWRLAAVRRLNAADGAQR